MNLEPSPGQQEIVSGLAGLLARFPAPVGQRRMHLDGGALDAALAEAGYHDLAEIGVVEAALAVHEVARQPLPVEFAASVFAPLALRRPMPRPVAVIANNQPARFLPGAQSVILLGAGTAHLLHPAPEVVEKLDSLYAYPMGKLRNAHGASELSATQNASFRQWHRLWIAIEICGAMRAALEATVAHVTLRRQFGRPLGSFQALQHRLAADATWLEAAWLLCQRAAWSGNDADGRTALRQALSLARSMTHDAHQFHGAIGLTLEHVLHHFTYRIGALRSELID